MVFKIVRKHILRTDQENMLSIQTKEIRTLPHGAETAVIGRQDSPVLPVQQILALKEQDLSTAFCVVIGYCSDIGPVRSLPHLGISEIETAGAFGKALRRNHRILSILGIIDPVSDGDALGLDTAALSLGIRGLTDGGIHKQVPSVIHGDGASGKTALVVIYLIGRHGCRQRRPVKKVHTDRMSPVHGSPHGRIGIILIEHVELALIVAKTIWVIHPAAAGGQMEKRPFIRRNLFLVYFFVSSCIP